MRRFGTALIVAFCLALGLFATSPGFWLRYGAAQWSLPVPTAWMARPEQAIEGVDAPANVQSLPDESAARLQTLSTAKNLAAFIVMRDGAVVFQTPTGDARETFFEGGALSLLLPVLLTGALLADGTLPAFDAPIGQWLPDFDDPRTGDIRLVDLLTQSSGLEIPTAHPNPFSAGTRFHFGSDVNAALTSLSVARDSGAGREVNPADAQALTQLIERARGEDFASLFARRLWHPLGGGTAVFALDRPGGTALTHCCFRARAIDWVRLMNLFSSRGRREALQILPAQFLEDMAKPSVDPRYGMGVRRLGHDHADLPPDTIAVHGENGAWLVAIPSARVTIALFGGPSDEAALIAVIRETIAALPSD